MKKFYFKKEVSQERNSTFQKLHRRHRTMAEGRPFSQEILHAAALRAASVSNIDQIEESQTSTATPAESKNRTLDEYKVSSNDAAASTVVITESELSSSWLYKNMKVAVDSKKENKLSPLPPVLSAKPPTPPELGTVELQNSGMKPILIPSTKRPEKTSSRCCYLFVVMMICICTLGLLSAIGGILYLEVFAAREQQESVTQMSAADELLRSAIRMKTRDANSNKYIPYESKDVLYSDIQTIINEANAKNKDAARYLTTNSASKEREGVLQQTEASVVETFTNTLGEESEVYFQTAYTEHSFDKNSTPDRTNKESMKISEPTSEMESNNAINGEKEFKWELIEGKSLDSTKGNELTEGKELPVNEGLLEQVQKSSNGILERRLDHLSSTGFNAPKAGSKVDNTNDSESSTSLPFIASFNKEATRVANELEQKTTKAVPPSHPVFLDSSNTVDLEETFGRFFPTDDADDVDVPSLRQNLETTKSDIPQQMKFEFEELADIIESNKALASHPDLMEPKNTVLLDNLSEQVSTRASLNTDNLDSLFAKEALNESSGKEAFFKMNEKNASINSDVLKFAGEIERKESKDYDFPSGENDEPALILKETVDNQSLHNRLSPDQDRKEISNMVSEIPLFETDHFEPWDGHQFNVTSSGFSHSASAADIPSLVTSAVTSEINAAGLTTDKNLEENIFSDASEQISQVTNPTEGQFNFNRPISIASIAPVPFLERFHQMPVTTSTTQQPSVPKRIEDLQASLAEVLKYLQPLDTKNRLPSSRTKVSNPTKTAEKNVNLNDSRFTTASGPDSTTERMRYLQKLREMMFERYFG